MALLVLVRHGESEWNAKSLWTGLTDVGLTEKGHEQARTAASLLKDKKFDICFTSALSRSKQTWEDISKILCAENIPTTAEPALNERDYGELTGKNKWKIKEEYGEEQFNKWRRGWDFPPPSGESLKDVYNRVVPYFKTNILPELMKGKNVIIVAHGNSLRTLIKYLDNIPDEEIASLELGLSEPYIYEIDNEGKVLSKKIISIGSIAP